MARQRVQDPYKRLLTPAPDGARVDFELPEAYKPGTVSVWRNGLKKDPALDDGYLELPPTTVRMKQPPLSGDTLWGEYERA